MPDTAAAEAEECEIEWFRGYVKSQFYAVTHDGDGLPRVLESPWFRWHQVSSPPPQQLISAAHHELLDALAQDGWQPCGHGDEWWNDRLTRTAYSSPGAASTSPSG